MEISSTSSLGSGMDLSLTHVLLIYVSLGISGSLRMIKMLMLMMVVLVVGQDKENVIKLYSRNKVRSTSSPLLTHKFIAGISNWIYCIDIKTTVNQEEMMV